MRVGVLLGTRRVNQKPVLQVFDLDGRLLGYAKVGHNDLTAALVRREAASLASGRRARPALLPGPAAAPPRTVGRTGGPRDLAPGHQPATAGDSTPRDSPRCARWRGCPAPPAAPWPRAASGPGSRATADRLAGEPDGRPAAGRCRRDRAVPRRRPPVSLGGWHGDWGSWNMGMGDGVLQVWDWERYDPEVPLGFDGLHFAAQSVRPGERDERRQEEPFLRSVPPGPGRRSASSPDQPRPHAPPLPARDRRPLRRRPDARCDACAATTHLLGARRCWSGARCARAPPRRKDDHDRARSCTPPRQDRRAGRVGARRVRHRRPAPAPVVHPRRRAAGGHDVAVPGPACRTR